MPPEKEMTTHNGPQDRWVGVGVEKTAVSHCVPEQAGRRGPWLTLWLASAGPEPGGDVLSVSPFL